MNKAGYELNSKVYQNAMNFPLMLLKLGIEHYGSFARLLTNISKIGK